MTEKSNHSLSFGCGFLILLVIAGLFLLSTNQASSSHEITLRASGTASAVLVTFTNSQGITEQHSGAVLPWNKTYNAESGDMVVLDVINQGGDGSVTAEILIDGKIAKTSISSGATTSAICGLTVP